MRPTSRHWPRVLKTTPLSTTGRQLPALSRQDDGVRRFIALVDECYDRSIPLYLNAAVPLNQLYSRGALGFPFRRTLSRLQEMQLQRFGQYAVTSESDSSKSNATEAIW